MKKFCHQTVKSLYACAVLLGAAALFPACADEAMPEDDGETQSISINVRFEDEEDKTQQIFGLHSLLAPLVRSDVDRIVVDVRYAADDRPFVVNFALTKISNELWEGILPVLPASVSLKFVARAYDGQTEIFSGDTLATLTTRGQQIQIPLSPKQNDGTFDMPRMRRIVYPERVVAGQEMQVIFTIQGNAGETIAYNLTSADGSTPFSPAEGTVTLTNTVADFIALYTAPEVTAEREFVHEVTITSADALSSVEISTNFATRVVPRSAGAPVVLDPTPQVIFRPVVLSLNANGTAIPDAVELEVEVSNDGPVTFEWSFARNMGTPEATFMNNTGNPAVLQGYTVDVQGLITLRVTDPQSGTTTLKYELQARQFEDAIDHDAVNGLKRIVAGDAHTCALTGTGDVRCWGQGQFGQLGYGESSDVGTTPASLPFTAGRVPLPEPATQLVAGDNHTCALLASGLMYCWGLNSSGQLGYSSTQDVGDAEEVYDLGYVSVGDVAVKIAAGGDHTCAILQGGILRCWGRNNFGQLGRGHVNNIGDNELVYTAGNVPVGVPVQDVALGDDHTCALLETGNMRCWGRNNNGQLGYGHGTDVGGAAPITSLPDVAIGGLVRKIAAGDAHTCVLLRSGKMRCWGQRADGRTGYGFFPAPSADPIYGNQATETPVNLVDINVGAAGVAVTDIAVGDAHSCALLSDGALKCWGNGGNGRLGYGNVSNVGTPPAAGVDLLNVSAYQLTAGSAHTCALRSNGTARCWGLGANGRLGSGATAEVRSPAAAPDIQVFASSTP